MPRLCYPQPMARSLLPLLDPAPVEDLDTSTTQSHGAATCPYSSSVEKQWVANGCQQNNRDLASSRLWPAGIAPMGMSVLEMYHIRLCTIYHPTRSVHSCKFVTSSVPTVTLGLATTGVVVASPSVEEEQGQNGGQLLRAFTCMHATD